MFIQKQDQMIKNIHPLFTALTITSEGNCGRPHLVSCSNILVYYLPSCDDTYLNSRVSYARAFGKCGRGRSFASLNRWSSSLLLQTRKAKVPAAPVPIHAAGPLRATRCSHDAIGAPRVDPAPLLDGCMIYLRCEGAGAPRLACG